MNAPSRYDICKAFSISGVLAGVLFFGNGPLSLVSESYAHFEHLPIYNGRSESQGMYYVYQALGSDYARPQEPTTIMFSVQDRNGNDAKDVVAMIEVYTSKGDRIKAFPWTKYETGDFEVPFAFPEAGSYQIVLSTANAPPARLGSFDPPREILSSTANCDCNRSIFNVAITERFGTVWNSVIATSLGVPLAIVGGILGLTYRKRMKQYNNNGPGSISRLEVAKYSIMLSAIAGGIVHLSIYIAHASLRLEYSIFFVIAGGMQIAYGTMYIFLVFSGTSDRDYYGKSMRVNLFGFAGTAILVGLYAYTIVLPAPLSPTNMPDRIEVAGVLAKSLEIFLLIGIIYIIREEKRRNKHHLTNVG